MDNIIKILVMFFIVTILFILFILFPCWALYPINEIQDADPHCYVRFSDATECETKLEDPGSDTEKSYV